MHVEPDKSKGKKKRSSQVWESMARAGTLEDSGQPQEPMPIAKLLSREELIDELY